MKIFFIFSCVIKFSKLKNNKIKPGQKMNVLKFPKNAIIIKNKLRLKITNDLILYLII